MKRNVNRSGVRVALLLVSALLLAGGFSGGAVASADGATVAEGADTHAKLPGSACAQYASHCLPPPPPIGCEDVDACGPANPLRVDCSETDCAIVVDTTVRIDAGVAE